MKLKSILTICFVAYIIVLSFVPLVHDRFLAQERWIGYGSGSYLFQDRQYFVLFNDPFDGSSKPQVYLNPEFAPAARISLIEFSDWASWIDERNLFNEFNVTIRARPRALAVTYSRPEIVVEKLVEVAPDSVRITLRSQNEFKAHLELWRWVMTSVNGVSISNTPKPLSIPATRLVEFTFEDQQLQSLGHGIITLSGPPAEIKIWPHEKGFNKISIDFVDSEMTFVISGSMERNGTPSATWSTAYLPYVLPVVAISIVALYLVVEKYGRSSKNRVVSHSD